ARWRRGRSSAEPALGNAEAGGAFHAAGPGPLALLLVLARDHRGTLLLGFLEHVGRLELFVALLTHRVFALHVSLELLRVRNLRVADVAFHRGFTSPCGLKAREPCGPSASPRKRRRHRRYRLRVRSHLG